MERLDLLHFIHKALRHAILTFNVESGRTDFADPGAVAVLTKAWNDLCTNLGHHAEHEDEIIFPLLRDRAPGGEVDDLYADHERIVRIEHELDALLLRVDETTDAGTRRLLGREFHRSIQRYTAMCLLHFDAEERHFQPRVWALYDDDELTGTFGRVMATIGPDELQYGMSHMAEALDPTELDELRKRVPA